MARVAAGGHVFRVLDTGRAGTPILFAADAPVVLEHYAPVLDQLAGGRRGVALELPGFGFSTPARGYRFRLREQVDALAALLDAMSIERATLAFTCVNALVALALAVRAPTRVERLVLAQIPSVGELTKWASRIDVKILGHGALRTPVLGQLVMAGAPSAIAERWFHAALSPAAPAASYASLSRRAYRNGGAFCLAALNQALGDLRPEDVGTSPVPTTVVWGDADRTHRRTDKASSRVWHPALECIRWGDAGHCPELERPAAFAALLA